MARSDKKKNGEEVNPNAEEGSVYPPPGPDDQPNTFPDGEGVPTPGTENPEGPDHIPPTEPDTGDFGGGTDKTQDVIDSQLGTGIRPEVGPGDFAEGPPGGSDPEKGPPLNAQNFSPDSPVTPDLENYDPENPPRYPNGEPIPSYLATQADVDGVPSQNAAIIDRLGSETTVQPHDLASEIRERERAKLEEDRRREQVIAPHDREKMRKAPEEDTYDETPYNDSAYNKLGAGDGTPRQGTPAGVGASPGFGDTRDDEETRRNQPPYKFRPGGSNVPPVSSQGEPMPYRMCDARCNHNEGICIHRPETQPPDPASISNQPIDNTAVPDKTGSLFGVPEADDQPNPWPKNAPLTSPAPAPEEFGDSEGGETD